MKEQESKLESICEKLTFAFLIGGMGIGTIYTIITKKPEGVMYGTTVGLVLGSVASIVNDRIYRINNKNQ